MIPLKFNNKQMYLHSIENSKKKKSKLMTGIPNTTFVFILKIVCFNLFKST